MAVLLVAGVWLFYWHKNREPLWKRNWNKFVLDCTPGELMEVVEYIDDSDQKLVDFRDWQGHGHSCGIFETFNHLVFHAVVFYIGEIRPGDLIAMLEYHSHLPQWFFVLKVTKGDEPNQLFIYMAHILEPNKD